jgi:hypothetical protein
VRLTLTSEAIIRWKFIPVTVQELIRTWNSLPAPLTINDNERELGSPPVHPAMFLAQLLGPIFHEVSEIKISFQKGVDFLPGVSMLPLVPSATDFMAEGSDPKIRLDLRAETESGDVQFLNNTLLGYQHLRHLVVPPRSCSKARLYHFPATQH